MSDAYRTYRISGNCTRRGPLRFGHHLRSSCIHWLPACFSSCLSVRRPRLLSTTCLLPNCPSRLPFNTTTKLMKRPQVSVLFSDSQRIDAEGCLHYCEKNQNRGRNSSNNNNLIAKPNRTKQAPTHIATTTAQTYSIRYRLKFRLKTIQK